MSVPVCIRNFFTAVNNNDLMTVKLLINRGIVHVDKRTSYKKTALAMACEKNRIEIVSFLLEMGADVNVIDSYGNTPLLYACKKNNREIVSLLLNAGASVNVKDDNNISPLMYAIQNGFQKVTRLICEKRPNFNEVGAGGLTALMHACRKNDFLLVKYLLKFEPNVNQPDDLGQSAIFHAEDIKIVKLLLDNGANPNLPDHFGNDSLLKRSDRSCLYEDFIKLGWNINRFYSINYTLLMLDSMNGDKESVMKLLKNGACVNIKDSSGRTAIMYACLKYKIDIVGMLIKCPGLDINHVDKNGENLLFYLCNEKNQIYITRALSLGININQKNKNGHTVLSLIENKNVWKLNIFRILEKKYDGKIPPEVKHKYLTDNFDPVHNIRDKYNTVSYIIGNDDNYDPDSCNSRCEVTYTATMDDGWNDVC